MTIEYFARTFPDIGLDKSNKDSMLVNWYNEDIEKSNKEQLNKRVQIYDKIVKHEKREMVKDSNFVKHKEVEEKINSKDITFEKGEISAPKMGYFFDNQSEQSHGSNMEALGGGTLLDLKLYKGKKKLYKEKP
ncbi:hypothetical protein Gotur_007317 [Gossypium turneri]